jgi:hypothetical protein
VPGPTVALAVVAGPAGVLVAASSEVVYEFLVVSGVAS